MRVHRASLLGAAALSATALLPAAVVGAPAPDQASFVDSQPPYRSPGQLTLIGSAANNDVSVDLDTTTNEYLVSDRVGLTAGPNCQGTSATSARCIRFGNDRVVVVLKGGDDRFKVLTTKRGGRVYGRGGNDRIASSAADSAFYGDEGQDRLRGLGGEDTLDGGRGHDRLYGGPDNDRLFADNDDRDRTIACGKGDDDQAFIDRNLDPKPKGCEHIRRR